MRTIAFQYKIPSSLQIMSSVIICVSRFFSGNGVYRKEDRLGVKRVTEPNRTEPPDYNGQSLRKLPIVAVPGFTAITELNYLA